MEAREQIVVKPEQEFEVKIDLKINGAAIVAIVKNLSYLPYHQVSGLIESIQEQVKQQHDASNS